MPLRHHGSVSLRIEHSRVRNHVAQAREVKSNEEREQRLQAQEAYQTPHISIMRPSNLLSKQTKGCKFKQFIKLPMWQL
jgi:hypothetical protein